jgi:uncharacterized repeat protein (TIGR01451 family)
MALTVAGTVTIAGDPAPNGSTVEIWSYSIPASTSELVTTVTTTGGTGAFTASAPDDQHDYRAFFDDGTNRGMSALQGPLGGTGDPIGEPTTTSVSIADNADPVNGGDNITYTITPTTTGSDGATSVTLTFTLDTSLTFVSSSGTGWVHSHVGQVVTAVIGFMPPGGGASAPVVVVATTTNANATVTSSASLAASNATTATDNETTVVNQVALGDGPGGAIQVPVTAAGFASVTGRTPTHIYTCQEASSNLIDQVGTENLIASTAAAAPLYQVPITNWTRKGVGFSETSGQKCTLATGHGPNPLNTAVAMLAYVRVRTVIATRTILMIEDAGASNRIMASMNTGGVLVTNCMAAAANAGTVDHRDTNVHPLLLAVDTANTFVGRWTDLEADIGTYGATPGDAVKGIGAVGGGLSFVGEVLGVWILEGANAQIATNAAAKTFLQSLGWTITAY